MGKIEIEGCQIAYTEAGSDSNPPILLLHGIMSHRSVWARTIETLQQSFHCIAIDHLGFGDSDKPRDGDYSIHKQAERALKVADHFGFDSFILIGHSMGGQIATYLAANLAPQRVSKLVSVDGVVTGELSKRVQVFNRTAIDAASNLPTLYSISLALTKIFKPYTYLMFSPWFYRIDRFPYESWALDREKAFNKEIAHSTPKAWDSLNATDLTPLLKNIAAPTLIIFGEQDGTVPVSQAHVFKEQLPAAQLVLIDLCGHFPMYEKFDEYIALFQKFLTQGD
jgi:pimeloyl-ACP methyl ester carboxylesterase